MFFQTPVPSDLSDFLVGLQSTLSGFGAKLDAIHSRLESELPNSPPDRQWFKVEEAAALLDKRPYTVRQWCNEGQINARKSEERRGGHRVWLISRDAIEHYKSYGLLSADPNRNRED
jgi:hypothetical protein